jgi:molybdopterin/thiamine biosynthesis adenylyltransferase
MKSLALAIRKGARDSGRGHPAIDGACLEEISRANGVSLREVEIAALEEGVVPARYLLNVDSLGIEGQVRLLRSCVGVCGLGGLGGFAVELLARLGVGRLILVDGDAFVEHNLNRQLLCTHDSLGTPKAEAAARRVRAVNPSVEVEVHRRFFSQGEGRLFQGADLVVDALDNIPSRLALQEHCAVLGIPMVHGAIAGYTGQVMTVYPGDPGLFALYPTGIERGVEQETGNPPFTPALVASLQVAEVVKVLCGTGRPTRGGFLLVDLQENRFDFVPLEQPE